MPELRSFSITAITKEQEDLGTVMIVHAMNQTDALACAFTECDDFIKLIENAEFTTVKIFEIPCKVYIR